MSETPRECVDDLWSEVMELVRYHEPHDIVEKWESYRAEWLARYDAAVHGDGGGVAWHNPVRAERGPLRLCTKCSPSHFENCETCFGYGVTASGSPVRAGDAGEHREGFAACPECGSDWRGVQPVAPEHELLVKFNNFGQATPITVDAGSRVRVRYIAEDGKEHEAVFAIPEHAKPGDFLVAVGPDGVTLERE